MTNAELKVRAKEQLGGKIFGGDWMLALLVCAICAGLEYAASSILPGIGVILLTGPLTYGQTKLFMLQAREGQKMDVGKVFDGFRDDFGGIFLIGLMTGLFTVLWSLLLVVPGIVKGYAYSLALYIKADHPDYDWRRCIDESIRMMDGYKWRKFTLHLSFLGWYIVGALCLGIGTFWVTPYFCAADAQFYEALKNGTLS